MEDLINYLKSLLYMAFMYIGVNADTVLILFVLMSLDSILGIIKALRLGRKFSFKVLAWGMVSKVALLIIPAVLALIGKGIGLNFNLFVLATMNILIVNEGLSCFTNILSIKTRSDIENNDYVTVLLNTVRKLLMSYVDKFLKIIENGKKL